MNLTVQEQKYYDLIIDILDDGTINDSERSLLDKRKSKYGISDERAKEIEDFALQEIQNKNKLKFNTEGEEEYYELLMDMLEDGVIDDSERSLLDKRKLKYGISDERAKEFEDYIKDTKGISKNILDITDVDDTILNSYNEENTNDLFEQGKSYYNNGNYKEAIKCLNKAVELNPNDANNWHWLGISYHENEEYSEAIRCLNKAVELNPNNEYNWYWLGNSYYKNEEYSEAIRCLNKAVELNPNNEYNWYWLGRSYSENKEYSEAIRCFKKTVKLNPNNYNNWHWLGNSYYENKEYSEAIRCFKKAVKLNPNDADSWSWLGCSYNQNGQFEDAEIAFNNCLGKLSNTDEFVVKEYIKLNKKKKKVKMGVGLFIRGVVKTIKGEI
ncbi:tetratricopeptide repeat protein [Brachyspira murdochii]|uniref:tetratricopeptide repeat protein n=1 Tax=Brachyspira murdochii TaxID=84378 RepID=UPI003007C380